MRATILASALLLTALSACRNEPAPAPGGATDDAPPATAPETTALTAAPEASATPVEAAAPDGDRQLARFDGYGDIRFGTAAKDMEQAWGGKLRTLGKEANESCYFMTPVWVKTPAEFNFMIGDGKFARFGTRSDRFVAPGGGKVGRTKAEIAALYAGRIDEQPHKYTDGQYLRIADPAGGKGVLVFESDAKGDAAKVGEWRVGVPPQVDFVEGCS